MTVIFKKRVEREVAEKGTDDRSMMPSWKRLSAITGTLGVVAGCLLVSGAGTASAGSNGQQINYYSHTAYGQCTTGYNQNDQYTQNCTYLESGPNLDYGYWWVGGVDITWYNDDGSTVNSTCNVPRSMNGDFYTCYQP